MTVRATPTKAFIKALKGLPPNRQDAAISALSRFQAEPALPGLKFRPLAGKPGFFIISSVHGDRIILCRDEAEVYSAVEVGPHDNIYRRWNRR